MQSGASQHAFQPVCAIPVSRSVPTRYQVDTLSGISDSSCVAHIGTGERNTSCVNAGGGEKQEMGIAFSYKSRRARLMAARSRNRPAGLPRTTTI